MTHLALAPNVIPLAGSSTRARPGGGRGRPRRAWILACTWMVVSAWVTLAAEVPLLVEGGSDLRRLDGDTL